MTCVGHKPKHQSDMRLAENWSSLDPEPRLRRKLLSVAQSGSEDERSDLLRNKLSFGTAGLRGLVGPGPNRMNEAIVRITTQAVALRLGAPEDPISIVVGYDGRNDSKRFANQAAATLKELGAVVYLSTEVIPTPLAAYALSELKCDAGIVVTASHNPPEYNGYKLFWSHGSQITSPLDEEIAALMDGIVDGSFTPPKVSGGTIKSIPKSVFDKYFGHIKEYEFSSPSERANLSVAYSAMHGVGGPAIERALKDSGIKVFPVASQHKPDGNFPTVAFPNPEEPGATDLLKQTATKNAVDIAIANDPDADRLAALAPTTSGEFKALTGDEVGVLLATHLIEQGCRGIFACSIVSSSLLRKIARANHQVFLSTLTGFKWISKAARDKEAKSSERFMFGYEEALGYCVGGVVRDKDGVGAAVTFCDLVAKLKSDGLTVWDKLDEIAKVHGVFATKQVSIKFPGLSGATKMANLMNKLRNDPVHSFGTFNVDSKQDLLKDKDYPKSNVLIFHLPNDGRVIVRPSGTEPKVKCYYQVKVDVHDGNVTEARKKAGQLLTRLCNVHQKEVTST